MCFKGLKLNVGLFSAFIGCKGQIYIAYSVLSDRKALPYQFGLASISGFQDHSEVMGIQTNRNQLVNITHLAGTSLVHKRTQLLGTFFLADETWKRILICAD